MSIHNKLEKVRKPRIHIKYDVETEGATLQKELPFVVGVMGDFAGNNPGISPKELKDRKFIKIDPDNVDDVIKKIEPGVKMRVTNSLADDGSEMAVNLKFNSMQDFEPVNIVNQVPALKELKAVRDKLRDLLSKTDRSDELEKLLEQTLQDPKAIQHLARELGIEANNK